MKIATRSFAFNRTAVRQGTVAQDDDPRVAANPGAWMDAQEHLARSIETATARPGQVRNVAPPAPPAAEVDADGADGGEPPVKKGKK